MLSGFGSIEAGKRDGNVMELEPLMGCHLTMYRYQNSGDRSNTMDRFLSVAANENMILTSAL